MHAFVNKLETHLANSNNLDKADLNTLRQTINGQHPEYAEEQLTIDTIIADIVRYGQLSTPVGRGSAVLPHDAIVQLFPGGDLPETGVNSLIEIPGIWQPTESNTILGPGSMVICIGGTTSNIPPGGDVSDDKLPGASAAACPGASAACLVMMSC